MFLISGSMYVYAGAPLFLLLLPTFRAFNGAMCLVIMMSVSKLLALEMANMLVLV